MKINSQTMIRSASGGLGIAALAAVGWYTYDAFNSGFSISSLRIGWLGAAFGVHLAIIALLPVLWIWLLRLVRSESESEVRLNDPALYSMYGRSWLARYVPGRIWMFGGRVLYGKRAGVSSRSISSSSFLEAAISYSAIALLGVAFLAGAWLHWTLTPLITMTGAGGSWLLLRMTVGTGRPGNTGGRLSAVTSKISPWLAGAGQPSGQELAAVVAAYWAHAFAQLIFFILVALSVGDNSAKETMLLAGAWGVGAGAGYISVFSAGGLGVRDGVALAFVGPALTGPVAATIVAASRVILIVADLVFVGIVEAAVFAINRRRTRESGTVISLPHSGAEQA